MSCLVKTRLWIDLYYFQNMSVKEIGRILGYSQSWVKIHLFRARKQVAKLLKERGYEDEIF